MFKILLFVFVFLKVESGISQFCKDPDDPSKEYFPGATREDAFGITYRCECKDKSVNNPNGCLYPQWVFLKGNPARQISVPTISSNTPNSNTSNSIPKEYLKLMTDLANQNNLLMQRIERLEDQISNISSSIYKIEKEKDRGDRIIAHYIDGSSEIFRGYLDICDKSLTNILISKGHFVQFIVDTGGIIYKSEWDHKDHDLPAERSISKVNWEARVKSVCLKIRPRPHEGSREIIVYEENELSGPYKTLFPGKYRAKDFNFKMIGSLVTSLQMKVELFSDEECNDLIQTIDDESPKVYEKFRGTTPIRSIIVY